MNEKTLEKIYILIGIGLVFIAAIAGFLIRHNNSQQGNSFTGRTSFNLIGTPTVSSTLTALYSGNSKVIASEYLNKLNLGIRYIPKSQGSFMSILVESSNDDGTTYFPVSMWDLSTATSSIKIYSEGVSSTRGLPILIPGLLTSASGTLYQASVDLTVNADHLRISAREDSTSTYGETYVRATLLSN